MLGSLTTLVNPTEIKLLLSFSLSVSCFVISVFLWKSQKSYYSKHGNVVFRYFHFSMEKPEILLLETRKCRVSLFPFFYGKARNYQVFVLYGYTLLYSKSIISVSLALRSITFSLVTAEMKILSSS